MELDRTSRERLDALSRFADGADLSLAVLDLARSALAAVPSFLALQVTVVGAGPPITVATSYFTAKSAVARSSLRLEVDPLLANGCCRRVVYLAEQADAFFEFKNQFPSPGDSDRRLVGHRNERLVVDDDVPAYRSARFAAPNLGDDGESSIQRAVGVLMDHGFSADAARTQLQVRAMGPGWTEADEARHLLGSIDGEHSRNRWVSGVYGAEQPS